MSYRPIEFIGGVLQYIMNGFKGKFSDYVENNWSFIIGFMVIILIVIILTYV